MKQPNVVSTTFSLIVAPRRSLAFAPPGSRPHLTPQPPHVHPHVFAQACACASAKHITISPARSPKANATQVIPCTVHACGRSVWTILTVVVTMTAAKARRSTCALRHFLRFGVRHRIRHCFCVCCHSCRFRFRHLSRRLGLFIVDWYIVVLLSAAFIMIAVWNAVIPRLSA